MAKTPSAVPLSERHPPVPSFFSSQGAGEPPLAELIADDSVRRLMARDGVREDQLLRLLDQVRTRLL